MKRLTQLLGGLWLLTLAGLLQANPAYLVDSQWLEDRIDDPNLVILEVRYYPHR